MSKFQKVGASARCILLQVQKALKSSELMEDLTKADFRTIKTFISNNVTAERLLVDILQSSTGEKHKSAAVTDVHADHGKLELRAPEQTEPA